jgi:hypothetical protein
MKDISSLPRKESDLHDVPQGTLGAMSARSQLHAAKHDISKS